MLTPGTLIDGKYRLDRLIASGGMGVVFAATNTALGRGVAVKILKRELADDARAAARLLAEARSVATLKSPYIAEVIDVGIHDTVPFIVMELLEGRTTWDIVQSEGPLPLERAADCLIQACYALGEAHRRGIVHRDVKPSNLFIARADDRERLKVIDFGISKTRAEERVAPSGHETTTGTLLGSPSFMSPEQIRSARDVDGRSDIWSLGVVLYFLLTGKKPFEAESLLEQMTLIVHEPAPSLEGPIDAVVKTCLSKDPDERYATTAELAAALARFASPRMRELAAKVPVGVTAVPSERAPGSRAPASRAPASRPTPRGNEEPTLPGAPEPSRPRARAVPLLWIGVVVGVTVGAALVVLGARRAGSASTAAAVAAPQGASTAADASSASHTNDPAPAQASAPAAASAPAPATPARGRAPSARPRTRGSSADAPAPGRAAPENPPTPPSPPTVKSGLPRVPD